MDSKDALQEAIARARMPEESQEGPARVGQLLSSLQGVYQESLWKLQRIEDIWSQVVPPGLKGACNIAGLDQGCLYVEVPSAAFMYELGLKQADLLAAIRARPGGKAVRQIRALIGDED
ncbi:MAG: DUF721 domain-containing protein [Sedimentisphaerales bacterium]|nr:DUF721 domain-containing protein [Sedimentisphaerales bacterium]